MNDEIPPLNNNQKLLTLIILILFYNFFFGINLKVKASENNYTFGTSIDKLSLSLITQPKNIFGFPDNSSVKNIETTSLEKEISELTANHPLQEMAPFIAKYNRKIAALIVGIGKKESDWGKRSPSKNGKTCYNYWGYKGAGSRGHALGHGCFGSAEEGVAIIGKRITELVAQGLDTPAEIVVWKCGRSCASTGGQASADKWISDVSIYYNKIYSNKLALK